MWFQICFERHPRVGSCVRREQRNVPSDIPGISEILEEGCRLEQDRLKVVKETLCMN